MATLSLRMHDDLKAKARQPASQQGVSLNCDINTKLAATVPQAETLAMMGDRLSNIVREKLHARVMDFMTRTKATPEPTPAEIEQAIGKR